MPDRVYIPKHTPPSWTDRVAAHWVEVGLAVLGIVRGGVGLVAEYTDLIVRPVSHIPPPLGALVGCAVVFGGIAWVYAIAIRFKTLNRHYHILRTSLVLSLMGWASYFISTVMFKPNQAMEWALALVCVISIGGLYAITFLNERSIRKGGLTT